MSDEKRQSFDEFKDKVYDDIRFLKFLESDIADEFEPTSVREGCFKSLLMGFSRWIIPSALRKARETRKIDELSTQAYDLLAQSDVMERLCKRLDESIKLPIDVANVISPVLYEIADEENLPFDTMLFALIAKKISDRGVKNYCG